MTTRLQAPQHGYGDAAADMDSITVLVSLCGVFLQAKLTKFALTAENDDEHPKKSTSVPALQLRFLETTVENVSTSHSCDGSALPHVCHGCGAEPPKHTVSQTCLDGSLSCICRNRACGDLQ